MKPPHPGTPLSSEELAREARKAGVQGDQLISEGTDPHLPASEAEELEDEEVLEEAEIEGEGGSKPSPIDRALTELPPG